MCAWATYRGALVSIPTSPGFLSVWSASVLHHASAERIAREHALEWCRATFYPNRVSRLIGMFCFTELRSAEKALEWGSHFKLQNLAELSLAEVRRGDRLDSNWITYGDFDDPSRGACFGYWSGMPYPGAEPVWETILEGRLDVLGTDIRERAYARIEKHMPDSTPLAELGRIAAWVGSNLGAVYAFLRADGDYVELEYIMDMQEANDPAFIKKISDLLSSGHPMRQEASRAFAEDRVRAPDLRPFGFRKPKSELPFVGLQQAGPHPANR